MKQKLLRWILVLNLLYISCPVVYAESMNLIYDGKSHPYSNETIHLYIDGQEVVTTVMPPIQLNNNILVPAKEVFATTGAEVEWRPLEQSVYIHNDEILIVLKINSYEAWVNGEIKQLNMPAKLINNKVMIPLRFISESLGYTVTWSQADYSAYIITKEDDFNSSSDVLDNGIIEDTPAEDTIKNEPSDDVEVNIGPNLCSDYILYNTLDNTLSLSEQLGIQTAQITYEENADTRQIIIDLNGDYSEYFTYGSFLIEDSLVKKIDIVQENWQTRMVITTSTISALIVEEKNGQIMMRVVKPSQKYDKIVVLDAGHGDHDPGTTYGGVKEKDINLAVSNELFKILESDPNIKVYATRKNDTFLELMERVAFSNEIEPDLFISMHVNSVNGNPAVSGTETYYTVDTDTRNKTFATMVQDALVQEFGTRNRGVKSNTFVVTRYTDAPAILIEIGFLTNESDRGMMLSNGFENRYAMTVYQSILNYYAQGLHN